MKSVDIFFEYLNRDIQVKVLEAAGIKRPEEANWDVFPITTLYLDKDDEQ